MEVQHTFYNRNARSATQACEHSEVQLHKQVSNKEIISNVKLEARGTSYNTSYVSNLLQTFTSSAHILMAVVYSNANCTEALNIEPCGLVQ